MIHSTGIPLLRFSRMKQTIENDTAIIITDPIPIAALAPVLLRNFPAISSATHKQRNVNFRSLNSLPVMRATWDKVTLVERLLYDAALVN